MSSSTAIEWTDSTWNPVRGCEKISPGCKNCYAERFAERFRGVRGHPFEQGFDLRLVPEKLEEPLRWKGSRRIFVNSMSDLFHEQVPTSYIESVGEVIEACPQHAFQILTKRHARMHELLTSRLRWFAKLPNAWFGVSVENREYGLPRIKALRGTEATIKFLSVEPLLADLGRLDLSGLDWVIAGGESGPRYRPVQNDWIRNIRDQCVAQGVAFFFKQWGGRIPKANGRILDGRTWDELPNTRGKEVE